jgi:arylsulfatase A
VSRLSCAATAVFVLGLLAGTGARAAGPASSPSPSPPPNVVLILADDAGIETLGAYGGEYATPRLDALASQGVRFENGHATPLCTPSRVRLLTGRYSFRNYKAFGHLGRDEPTIAKSLRRLGYRTGAVGKWQLGGNPLDRVPGASPREAGFDEWRLWASGRDFLEEGCQHWTPTLDTNGRRETFPGQFGADLTHAYAVDFIRRNARRPFFLYYASILPHDPWVATPARRDAAGRAQQFAAMMQYLDAQVGDLLDVLERERLASRTLVVFVGDNGTHPLLRSRRRGVEVQGGKGSTLDAGTHVPLILRWPARLPAATVDDALVDLTDLYATIVGAAGDVAAAAASDGHDLARMLRDPTAPRREALFMDYASAWWPLQTTRYAFDANWKLYGDGRLFDLRADPLEARPVAPELPSPAARDARARLERVLTKMSDRAMQPDDAHFPAGFDPAAVDLGEVTRRNQQRVQQCGDPARMAPQPATGR